MLETQLEDIESRCQVDLLAALLLEMQQKNTCSKEHPNKPLAKSIHHVIV